MSVSGGKSKSGSSQSSKMNSFISPDQLPFLKDLWSQATGQILGEGLGAADTAGGQRLMGDVYQNPFMQGIQQFARPDNQMVQNNMNLLGHGLTQNLQNNLLPTIANTAIQSGGFGGGRQGVAQGLALQGTQQAFQQGSADIMNNAYNQAQQAALGGGQLAMQNALGGVGALGQLQQQQLAPLMSLAQILGSPTVLQSSKSKGGSSSTSSNFGFGFSS